MAQGFVSQSDLGFLPLQDHDPDVPHAVRMMLVGGRIFASVEGLWRDVGADAFSPDAAGAAAALARWRG